MDERQSKWLVVLSAVLALLVLGIVYLEPASPEAEGGRRWTRMASGRSVEQVTAISIRLDGRRAEIRREAGGWRWVDPVQVGGDGARIDNLVRSLIDLELGDSIQVEPEAVGINDTSPRLELTLDNAPPLVLSIGEDAPVGSSSYVQVGDGPVQASRTRIGAALPNQLDDLRVRTLTSFPRADVHEMSVSAIGNHPARLLQRDDLGWWLVDATPRMRASEVRVNTVIDALRFAKAEAFLDDSPPLAGAALQVQVRYGAPVESAVVRLARGMDDEWRASGPDQPGQVVLAATDLVDQLVVPEDQWLESRLMILHPTRLDRLEAELGADTLDAKRTAEGWSDTRAEPLLVAIETGQVQRGPELPVPAGAPTGRVLAHHGDVVTELVLYQELPGGDRVATESGTDAPMVVDAGTLTALRDAVRAED